MLEPASEDMQHTVYTSKIMFGYAFEKKKANRKAIYRWELPGTGDWVTLQGKPIG